jgi:hypothetical protein
VNAFHRLMFTTLLLVVSTGGGHRVLASLRPSLEDGPAISAPHIRAEDERLAGLLNYGTPRSALLQALVDRLESSDVVVYLRCDRQLRSKLSGQLSYVGTSGGLRYVLIRVRHIGDRLRQIALVGHELRHAVEVADAPEIVDRQSLQAAYSRIGYVNRFASVGGIMAFESDQAVQAGTRILRELRDGTIRVAAR